MSDLVEEKVIDRLITFAQWAKEEKLVKSQFEFERRCGLSSSYLNNTKLMSKSLGVDKLQRIYEEFPMLNLHWVLTGDGNMVGENKDDGYKLAYQNLRKKIKVIISMLKNI